MRFGRLFVYYNPRPTAIKFLPITFNPQYLEKGEKELNEHVSDGWVIIQTFQTEFGVVYHLARGKSSQKGLGSSSKPKELD